MKKIYFFITILFISGFIVGGLDQNIAVKTADATSWGNTCPAPNNICPSGGSLNACVSGFTFNTTVNYQNVPAGLTYHIDIYPANPDGSSRASGVGNCGGTVVCLLRSITDFPDVAVTAGKSSDIFGFDRIGCTTDPTCAPNQTDTYAVNVYFKNIPTGSTCAVTTLDTNGHPSISFEDIYNRNGSSSTETFTITCTTPTPSACPTPAAPQNVKILCPDTSCSTP